MNHEEIRHKLSEYLDGSLSPEEKAFVDEHLITCSLCSDALRELQKTVEHIRSMEEVEPPAWMTQKIMARVRDEEQKRKSIFQRLFFPLHIKLPLEAVGVLLLAVTVYITSQEAAPVRFSETGTQEWTTKGKAGVGPAPGPQTAERSIRQKRVPQEPEYKALDMKPAYEGAPPPVPKAAPEPMKPAEELPQLKDERSRERTSADSGLRYDDQRDGFRARSQAPAAAMAEKKAETAPAEKSGKQMLTLAVSDLDNAAARVEDTIKEYGGKILRKEPADGTLSLTVAIDVASRKRFIEKLKTLGELKGIDARETYKEGTSIEIRIVKQVQP